MKQLKPIIDKPSYHMPIIKGIYQHIYELIFKPLFEILEIKPSRENASTTLLIDSIRAGKLTYEGTYFKGQLNATLSKQLRAIGARYSKAHKAYQIEAARLPIPVKVAIAEAHRMAGEKLQKIETYLRAIEGRDLPGYDAGEVFLKTIDDLNAQFKRTTRTTMAENMEIPLREDLKEKLAEDYNLNLNKYIKDWYDEEIFRLREKITANVSQGFRAESLIKDIQDENGVSYRKAKFLARQETSLLVSKYRQIRYTENGLHWYKWSTSHDERVRPAHRALNGRYFQFDNPPVTDPSTSARNNPGEDFNCRCVAVPVISDTKELYLNKQKEKGLI